MWRERRLLAELNFSLGNLQTSLRRTHTHKSSCVAPPTSAKRQGGRQTESAAWACWSRLDCLPAQLLNTSLNYHNAAVWRFQANAMVCLCVWKCAQVRLITFFYTCILCIWEGAVCVCVLQDVGVGGLVWECLFLSVKSGACPVLSMCLWMWSQLDKLSCDSYTGTVCRPACVWVLWCVLAGMFGSVSGTLMPTFNLFKTDML